MGSDENRRLILARRARFMAVTLAGIGVAVACGGKESDPSPCLSLAADGGSPDSEARACLSIAEPPDANPQPCLAPLPPDAGDDASDGGDDGGDAGDGG